MVLLMEGEQLSTQSFLQAVRLIYCQLLMKREIVEHHFVVA